MISDLDIQSIDHAVNLLKLNKSCGYDGLAAEHILFAHPSIIVHIRRLFSMLIIHAFVPKAFGVGIIVPIIKDKCGDSSSPSNYRPITLSPIMSIFFENVLLAKFGPKLSSDDLQFGF